MACEIKTPAYIFRVCWLLARLCTLYLQVRVLCALWAGEKGQQFFHIMFAKTMEISKSKSKPFGIYLSSEITCRCYHLWKLKTSIAHKDQKTNTFIHFQRLKCICVLLFCYALCVVIVHNDNGNDTDVVSLFKCKPFHLMVCILFFFALYVCVCIIERMLSHRLQCFKLHEKIHIFFVRKRRREEGRKQEGKNHLAIVRFRVKICVAKKTEMMHCQWSQVNEISKQVNSRFCVASNTIQLIHDIFAMLTSRKFEPFARRILSHGSSIAGQIIGYKQYIRFWYYVCGGRSCTVYTRRYCAIHHWCTLLWNSKPYFPYSSHIALGFTLSSTNNTLCVPQRWSDHDDRHKYSEKLTNQIINACLWFAYKWSRVIRPRTLC